MTNAAMAAELATPAAVLDDAHLGDIRGALGTINLHDTAPRRGWRARALTLLAIMGPGLIVMVGDNDAGGVATYAQAGQNYGTSLMWALVLLVPVLIVNQEMVVRLGAVTGVGHARLILERFGRFWAAFSVGDLFLLNFLTIVTEFIGVSLAASYLGVPPYLAVPAGAVLLVSMTMSGSFRRWERCMFVFLVGSLLLVPLAVMSHPDGGAVLHDTVVPGIQGGFSSNAVLLIIAIVGTTVAPWQLFFQQSNVIDKRITPRWLSYERADTVIGAVVVVIGAAAVMGATAHVFAGTSLVGHFSDAGGVAQGVSTHAGRTAGAIFALFLLDASIIGASAVTLSTSYAFGDLFGARHSLHRGVRDAKLFYGSYAGMVVLAAAIVLLPGAPLGLMTTAVQALAGILLPSATVFLVLLCNDRAVLGPWVNRPWLNLLAGAIVGALLALSLILTVTTILPGVDVARLTLALAAVYGLALLAASVLTVARRRGETAPTVPLRDRSTWRMPPLARLERPAWSRGRLVAMCALSGYLLVAVVLLAVKGAELATGH